MKSKLDVVRLAGILSLLFIIVTIVWYLMVFWPTSDPQRIGEDLQKIANSPAQYLGFIAVDILYSLAIFALGGLFYLIFRSHSRSLALFGLLGFCTTGVMWMIMDIPALAIYPLAKEYVVASGATANTLANNAALLSLWGSYSDPIVCTFYGIGLLAFGFLIARSRVVPRPLGWLAMLGGALMLITWYNCFEGYIISEAAYYVTEFWYLPTGLWLLLRGIREAPAQS